MKNGLRKVLSFMLVIAMLGGFAVPAFAADAPASAERATTIPTVYIQGYGAEIYKDANNVNSEIIVGGDVPFLSDGVLGSLLENIMSPLMKGVTTGDYSEYNDYVVNALTADLGRFRLDDNGEPSDGSGNFCRRTKNVVNKKWYDGKYDIYAYSLVYDWRVDPFLTASELNEYIGKVKLATGSDKVNLVGRCLGANVVLAYLSEYGYDDINAVNFYVAGLEGFEIVGALFSGRVEVDSDALDRFLQATLDGEEDELIDFAKSLIAILNFVNGLDLPIDVVYGIYEQVYSDIIPRVLKESFGTMPAFWSFVGEEYYEDARKLNFPTTEEQTRYAGLLEKTDRYYNEVSLRTEDIITGAVESGVSVYFTAKYGFPAVPLSKEAVYYSDSTVSVTSQTVGATSTVMGKTFSADYIKNAEKNGTAKYISPDKCIDASTALLPDHIWFVKGSKHANMPNCVDIMMASIFEATGNREKYVSVNDIEEYPQYLYVENADEYAPLKIMTSDDADVGNEKWDKSIFEHLAIFLEKLLNFISELFSQIMSDVNKS
ncbi:MAG: hypothetical protein E7535_05475 [Ruminococcaceae bacterium]|nr:hypothetical protein [Oscillospiraceae bacterium]